MQKEVWLLHFLVLVLIMIQQTKNLNNLTKQNVCVQYPVLQRYIFMCFANYKQVGLNQTKQATAVL